MLNRQIVAAQQMRAVAHVVEVRRQRERRRLIADQAVGIGIGGIGLADLALCFVDGGPHPEPIGVKQSILGFLHNRQRRLGGSFRLRDPARDAGQGRRFKNEGMGPQPSVSVLAQQAERGLGTA
jgi:hypothetical protein